MSAEKYRDMTPAEKNTELKMLYKDRSDAAKDAYDYRPGGKLNEASNPDLLLESITGMTKDKQVDALIKASMPHMATLINDITITDDKLKAIA